MPSSVCSRIVESTALPQRPVGDIMPPDRFAPRYFTTGRFPSYRYVPGVHPHPLRDPAGHSYQASSVAAAVSSWKSDEWRCLENWLWGVDLFNAFFFWEAHEAWENLWEVRPRDSLPGLFLQGLIQFAAALIKVHLRSVDAAMRLAERGTAKLERVAADRSWLLGLQVADTRESFCRYFDPLEKRILPPLDASVPALLLRGVA